MALFVKNVLLLRGTAFLRFILSIENTGSHVPPLEKGAAQRAGDGSAELFKESFDEAVHKNPYEI